MCPSLQLLPELLAARLRAMHKAGVPISTATDYYIAEGEPDPPRSAPLPHGSFPVDRPADNMIAGNRIEDHPDGVGLAVFRPGTSCRGNVMRHNTISVGRVIRPPAPRAVLGEETDSIAVGADSVRDLGRANRVTGLNARPAAAGQAQSEWRPVTHRTGVFALAYADGTLLAGTRAGAVRIRKSRGLAAAAWSCPPPHGARRTPACKHQ
jgi:hypothetical protein